jgi:hypothetical protein
MSKRKPGPLKWETWVDRQIRDAQERGQFDDLPGKGKPIPGLDRPYDENWWIKQKLQREQLSALPPGLALRKEVETVLDNIAALPTETAVRSTFKLLNEKIAYVDAAGIGPPSRLSQFNVEAMVRRWEKARAEVDAAVEEAHWTPRAEDPEVLAERRRLFRLEWARFRRR